LLLNVFIVILLAQCFERSSDLRLSKNREGFIAGRTDFQVMGDVEQLRCNICDMLLTSAQVSKHAATSSHSSLKSKLVGDLEKVGMARYEADSSVILQWTDSLRD
jgi:hypothetical protein